MTINKKDYMEFAKKMNDLRGEWNDGYDLEEIESTLDEVFEVNSCDEIECFFQNYPDYTRFVKEYGEQKMHLYEIGYIDTNTDQTCYEDVEARTIDEARNKVRTTHKPCFIFHTKKIR